MTYLKHGEFRQLADAAGINMIWSPDYVPEGNGKDENFNGQITYTLARITLARYVRRRMKTVTAQHTWYPALQDAQATRNRHVSKIMGVSPYQFVFGQDPPDADELPTNIAAELSERREQDLELVRELRRYSAAKRIKNHEQEHGEELPEPREYQEGDLVWYYNKQQDEGLGTERKILPRWKSPYQVQLAAGKGSYYLVDLEGNSVKAKVNHGLLAPVKKLVE
ncbi:hypothetical protein HK097_001228 [Rhizophlyctis rosea]|uniref:Integrase catalytic domain-containing protein n=1 Tax=Rhizophlyctis rosea TaxID=64517 RepID=A0AAD5S5W0_9FUNG|nr:hypothetical protein HK097_001228 [Rhizophlyctis rosea]